MKRKITFALFTMAIIAAAGCATYAPQGNLPANMNAIAVPVFINKTSTYNIEQYVTQKTIDGFLADGKVSIVDERKADGIVKCRISKYVITPIRFDVNQVAQEYRLRIYMDVILFDNKAQKMLWKEEDMWEETTYFVVNNLGMPVEDETIGRTRILDKLAGRIVRRVVYGW
jgi:hypothetical protein